MIAKLPKRPPRNWHPGARQLYTYWLGKRPKDGLARREDIDPVEMPKILPSIYITEVVWADGKPRVKFRLIGTRIVERFGHDIGGMWMDKAYDQDYFTEVWPAYLAMIESQTPHYSDLNARYANKEHLTYSRLICPQSTDGKRVEASVGHIGFAGTKVAPDKGSASKGATA